jgi:hypothetical protein
MILVDVLTREHIQATVQELLSTGDFTHAFNTKNPSKPRPNGFALHPTWTRAARVARAYNHVVRVHAGERGTVRRLGADIGCRVLENDE